MFDTLIPPSNDHPRFATSGSWRPPSHAREHGCKGVELHVFGGNVGARKLYLRAGFVETNVTMLKRVDG
jgi:hypothetical protein